MMISEIMTREVVIMSPETTCFEVASRMRDDDIGTVIIGDNVSMIGIVTDRDLVIRGLAANKGSECPITELMTEDLCYCYEDEDIETVVKNMAEIQKRRLPVVNREKCVVGIISLANIAESSDSNLSQLAKGTATKH